MEKLKLWEVAAKNDCGWMRYRIVRGKNVSEALKRVRDKTGTFRLQFIEYVKLLAEED